MKTKWKWTCFKCGKKMDPALANPMDLPWPDIPPCDGLVFRSYGNYGSTIFDPEGTFEDERALEIAVCDECVKKHQRKVVYVIRQSNRLGIYLSFRDGVKSEKPRAKA